MSISDMIATPAPSPAEQYTADDIYSWFSNTTKAGKRLTVTDEALDTINKMVTSPEFDGFRFVDTLITYQSALLNDRVDLMDYINAIKFCAFMDATGGNTVEAYKRTFAHREFVKKNKDLPTDSNGYTQLCAAAGRYRKSPIVINIMTQAEVPLYIMFQGYRYKAVAQLVHEMENAKLSKDRINAADRLLTHLKPPENVKLELDIGFKKDNVVDTYEQMLAGMVAKQKELLEQKADVAEVANVKDFIEGEILDKEQDG